MTRIRFGRKTRYLIGIAIGVALLAPSQRWTEEESQTSLPDVTVDQSVVKPAAHSAFAAIIPTDDDPSESIEALAARDPVAFFKMAMERYDRSVRDYTCTFAKQERIGGRLGSEQVMETMFREKPFSVRFKWIKNGDKCSRVLYVDDRWIKDGVEMAVVEPGVIARLFVPYVMRAIHGADAKKSSRRTIDQFGVRSSMALTVKYVHLAREQEVPHSFEYKGQDKLAGRETFVFERHLPYESEGGLWPDRALVVHVDQELMLPVRVEAYADDAKKVLLGRYETREIKLNANLPNSTFTKQGMGL
jgi:hypothetical protein